MLSEDEKLHVAKRLLLDKPSSHLFPDSDSISLSSPASPGRHATGRGFHRTFAWPRNARVSTCASASAAMYAEMMWRPIRSGSFSSLRATIFSPPVLAAWSTRTNQVYGASI